MTSDAPLPKTDAGGLQAERDTLLAEFVVTNADYYRKIFAFIGSRSQFAWTFNFWAFVLGPIWYGCRSIWNWGLAFLILETFGWVQIVRGAFGDLAADAWQRIAQIEGTLAFRKKQLEAALDKGSEKAAVYQRAVDSLEQNIGAIRLEAQQIEDSGLSIVIFGVIFLLVVKSIQAVIANVVLEKRFFAWLSDSTISFGMRSRHVLLSLVFTGIILATTITHYAFPATFAVLADFPTRPFIRLGAIGGVEWFFNAAVANGEAVFDMITRGIRIAVCAYAVGGDYQLYCAVDWLGCWGAHRHLVSRIFRLYGGFGILGKSHDNIGIAWHCCLFVDCDWHPAWHVLCAAPAVLRHYPPDHGFYANHASLCLYDSGDCVFWHRKASGCCDNNDFWRHPGGASYGPWFARCA
jgi:hypothetical protein